MARARRDEPQGERRASEIERLLEERAGLYLAVEESGGAVVVSGLVTSDGEREAALDIARSVAGEAVVDEIAVGDALPEGIEDLDEAVQPDREQRGLPGAIDYADDDIEPGDFTDQATVESPDAAAGPSTSLEEDEVSEGDEVYVPPTDPVGTDTEVIGGLQVQLHGLGGGRTLLRRDAGRRGDPGRRAA